MRGVTSPVWTINGGFVVVTFMRPIKNDTQGDTHGSDLDKWIDW